MRCVILWVSINAWYVGNIVSGEKEEWPVRCALFSDDEWHPKIRIHFVRRIFSTHPWREAAAHPQEEHYTEPNIVQTSARTTTTATPTPATSIRTQHDQHHHYRSFVPFYTCDHSLQMYQVPGTVVVNACSSEVPSITSCLQIPRGPHYGKNTWSLSDTDITEDRSSCMLYVVV